MAAITLLTNQKVEITAQALDANGNQVDFTAPPVFTSSDVTVATVGPLSPTDPQPLAGEIAMWLLPVKAGSVTVTVTEDAVAGDDTTKLTASMDFVITAPVALAAKISLSAGAAVKK
jgi:CheY-specific phosphatase CheX